MKVLMVEPGKSPYETEIEGGLESLQAAVGGDIQATYPFDDLVGLICNDEGKLIGLPLNRALYDDEGHLYDIVPGNFLIVGLGEEDFTDLPADLIEKYTERFKYPEKFFRLAGEIVAVKQPLPPEEKQQPASVMEEPGRDDIRLTIPRIWPLTWMNFSGRTAGPMQTCTRIPMQRKSAWRTSCFQEIPEKSE